METTVQAGLHSRDSHAKSGLLEGHVTPPSMRPQRTPRQVAFLALLRPAYTPWSTLSHIGWCHVERMCVAGRAARGGKVER